MSYNVYLVVTTGMPQDHHAIFVETESDKTGWIYQVTGNIQNGMTHEDRLGENPEESATYKSKTLIGKVSKADYPRMKDVCWGIAAPKKQFDGPRRIDPNEPLRRCQEWTKDAIDALRRESILG